MIELVYFSEADPNLTVEDISILLKHSRDYNTKNNITGCLLYLNNEFLQILEGKKEAVQHLFTLIKEDKRHSNIIVLAEENKKEKTFPDWSMAFHKFNNDEIANKRFLNNIAAFSEITDKPSHVTDLFWTMAKQMATD